MHIQFTYKIFKNYKTLFKQCQIWILASRKKAVGLYKYLKVLEKIDNTPLLITKHGNFN